MEDLEKSMEQERGLVSVASSSIASLSDGTGLGHIAIGLTGTGY